MYVLGFFRDYFVTFLINYGEFHYKECCVDNNYDIHKVFGLEDL